MLHKTLKGTDSISVAREKSKYQLSEDVQELVEWVVVERCAAISQLYFLTTSGKNMRFVS